LICFVIERGVSVLTSLEGGDRGSLVNGSLGFLEGFLVFLNDWEFLQKSLWSEFDSNCDSERQSSEKGGSQVHLPSQWGGHEDDTNFTVLYHEELEVKFNKEDDEEPPVIEEAGEHVQFSS